MSKKCKYLRTMYHFQYVTSCGSEAEHPEDCGDWVYCPYCGRKIKFKNNASQSEVDHCLEEAGQ